MTGKKYNRKYKDSLFRMVFREKENLLSLYNAVNHTDYTNTDDLEVVTLENAIYMNIKNDIAFLMCDFLNMYEHQSTQNANMPLRDLFYIACEYEKLVDEKTLYRTKAIKIPTPRFILAKQRAKRTCLHVHLATAAGSNTPPLGANLLKRS